MSDPIDGDEFACFRKSGVISTDGASEATLKELLVTLVCGNGHLPGLVYRTDLGPVLIGETQSAVPTGMTADGTAVTGMKWVSGGQPVAVALGELHPDQVIELSCCRPQVTTAGQLLDHIQGDSPAADFSMAPKRPRPGPHLSPDGRRGPQLTYEFWRGGVLVERVSPIPGEHEDTRIRQAIQGRRPGEDGWRIAGTVDPPLVEIDTAERVRLTLKCSRRHHVMGTVVDSPNGRMIHHPRYAAGEHPRTWTAARFPLENGSGHRFGCACDINVILRYERLNEAIDLGYTEWIVASS